MPKKPPAKASKKLQTKVAPASRKAPKILPTSPRRVWPPDHPEWNYFLKRANDEDPLKQKDLQKLISIITEQPETQLPAKLTLYLLQRLTGERSGKEGREGLEPFEEYARCEAIYSRVHGALGWPQGERGTKPGPFSPHTQYREAIREKARLKRQYNIGVGEVTRLRHGDKKAAEQKHVVPIEKAIQEIDRRIARLERLARAAPYDQKEAFDLVSQENLKIYQRQPKALGPKNQQNRRLSVFPLGVESIRTYYRKAASFHKAIKQNPNLNVKQWWSEKGKKLAR